MDDDEDDTRRVLDPLKLQMKDGQELIVSKKAAELSGYLKKILLNSPNETTISLPDINTKEGKSIIRFLHKHVKQPLSEIKMPLAKLTLKDLLKEDDVFYYDFMMKLSTEEVADLVVAAKIIEIHPLVDICCAKYAYMCKDKTEEEIFKAFNITETFTEEEKNIIKENNKWIEENITIDP